MKLHSVLISTGYKCSKLDPCIYFKIEINFMIFIAIYVDDVLYFTNCTHMKNELYDILTSNFKMKDLGEAQYCLGIRIKRDKDKGIIYLDQEKYINEILEKFGMNDCKPIDTPCDPNQKLTKNLESENDFDQEKIPYQINKPLGVFYI